MWVCTAHSMTEVVVSFRVGKVNAGFMEHDLYKG